MRMPCIPVLALLLVATATAQTYPSRPVRIVIPLSPGGTTDVPGRIIAQKLSETLGQQFYVENRAGAGGTIGSDFVAKANADGYTLLAIIPSFTFSPALYKNYPIDPIRDFAPVSLLTRAPYLLVVNPSLPARSAKDLIAMAKAQPDKLTFGAGNTGSGTHLVTLSFLSAAKIRATYVPYRSVGMAMLDLAGGRIDATLANVLSASTYVRTGKLRVLGISSVERSKALPDVPTIAEQGVPGYEAVTFHGYAVPAATPAAIVNKLSAAYASVVKSPDIAGRLAADGGEAIGSTPQAFRKFIAAEIRVWTKLIKEEGVKIE